MFSIPRNPNGLIQYAFRALGKDSVFLRDLVFFISFDLRQMPPSRVHKLIQKLNSAGHLLIEDGLVQLSSSFSSESDVTPPAATAVLGEMLRQFISSSRLTRAVGMDDQSIRFVQTSQPPLKIEATVYGSQEYRLVIDEAKKRIEHNCPDWKRVSVVHRFCKHVAKLVLLLKKEDALRLLSSLQEGSWEFVSL
ncbi:MAG: DUF2240 family protein [Candidatus Hodarchaeota archaeon]